MNRRNRDTSAGGIDRSFNWDMDRRSLINGDFWSLGRRDLGNHRHGGSRRRSLGNGAGAVGNGKSCGLSDSVGFLIVRLECNFRHLESRWTYGTLSHLSSTRAVDLDRGDGLGDNLNRSRWGLDRVRGGLDSTGAVQGGRIAITVLGGGSANEGSGGDGETHVDCFDFFRLEDIKCVRRGGSLKTSEIGKDRGISV